MHLSDEQQLFVDSLRSGKHTHHQLRMKLQSLPKSERFVALLYLFTDSNHYGNQLTAGRLLVQVMPSCQENLSATLDDIASTWNPSVKNLPFYLSDVFGINAVVDTANSIASRYPEDARERRAMETVAWWLIQNR